MGDRVVDALDAILSIIFGKMGIKKCSKCELRIRYAQFMLIATWPFKWNDAVDDWRVEWEARVNRGELKEAVL